MRWPERAVLILTTLMLTAVSPALASDCLYMGVPSSQGALICQTGVIAQCSAGQWVPTQKMCTVETTAAPQNTPAAVPAAPYLLHILTAAYNVGDTGEDVVFSVRDLCEGKEACSFLGDAKFLQGDPAPRQHGRFSIIYECTTGFQSKDAVHVVFRKNETIRLGCR